MMRGELREYYKRENLIRSCLKKKRYSNRELAETVAKRSTIARGTPIYVYLCKHCGGYHLTHLPRRQQCNI